MDDRVAMSHGERLGGIDRPNRSLKSYEMEMAFYFIIVAGTLCASS